MVFVFVKEKRNLPGTFSTPSTNSCGARTLVLLALAIAASACWIATNKKRGYKRIYLVEGNRKENKEERGRINELITIFI
jgi:hypothetical protein